MTQKQRTFKSHEPTTGDAGRKAHQQASMVFSKMPNARFNLNVDRLADDPEYRAWACIQAEKQILKSGAMRRAGLNEVSYKMSGRVGYSNKDRL